MRAPTSTLDPPAPVATAVDRDIYRRILAEFDELPGHRLTVRQAARLFTVEPTCCECVLEAMVHDGILVTDGATFSLAPEYRKCA
jgi:hypothetical protein